MGLVLVILIPILILFGAVFWIIRDTSDKCIPPFHKWGPWSAGLYDKIPNKVGWSRQPIQFRRCSSCRKLGRKVVSK